MLESCNFMQVKYSKIATDSQWWTYDYQCSPLTNRHHGRVKWGWSYRLHQSNYTHPIPTSKESLYWMLIGLTCHIYAGPWLYLTLRTDPETWKLLLEDWRYLRTAWGSLLEDWQLPLEDWGLLPDIWPWGLTFRATAITLVNVPGIQDCIVNKAL